MSKSKTCSNTGCRKKYKPSGRKLYCSDACKRNAAWKRSKKETIVTEKTTNLSEQNKIVFKVPVSANKKNLKTNIEKIFKVNVTKINIINKKNRTKITRGRKVKVSGFKKAIITLKKGQSIDLTTGV